MSVNEWGDSTTLGKLPTIARLPTKYERGFRRSSKAIPVTVLCSVLVLFVLAIGRCVL